MWRYQVRVTTMVVSSENHMGRHCDKMIEYTCFVVKLLQFKSSLSHFRADLNKLLKSL